MKRIGILALVLGLMVGVAGCEEAQKRAGDVKDTASGAVDDTASKAKSGDLKGAGDAAKKGVEDVKDAAAGGSGDK